jgi:hypothetical protein
MNTPEHIFLFKNKSAQLFINDDHIKLTYITSKKLLSIYINYADITKFETNDLDKFKIFVKHKKIKKYICTAGLNNNFVTISNIIKTKIANATNTSDP